MIINQPYLTGSGTIPYLLVPRDINRLHQQRPRYFLPDEHFLGQWNIGVQGALVGNALNSLRTNTINIGASQWRVGDDLQPGDDNRVFAQT